MFTVNRLSWRTMGEVSQGEQELVIYNFLLKQALLTVLRMRVDGRVVLNEKDLNIVRTSLCFGRNEVIGN